jgi:hypothetical protein
MPEHNEFAVIIDDTKPTQEQLNAITPVLNESMHRRWSKKALEQHCRKAMEEAGCPLITKA